MFNVRSIGKILRGRPTQNFCCKYPDGTQEKRFFPDTMDVDVPDVCERIYRGDPECETTVLRQEGSRNLFSGGRVRKTKRRQKRMKSRRLRRSTLRNVKRKRKQYVKRK